MFDICWHWGFQEKPFTDFNSWLKAIQEAAADSRVESLTDMVIADPIRRASAGDMLDKLFGGKGCSTSPPADKAVSKSGESIETRLSAKAAVSKSRSKTATTWKADTTEAYPFSTWRGRMKLPGYLHVQE